MLTEKLTAILRRLPLPAAWLEKLGVEESPIDRGKAHKARRLYLYLPRSERNRRLTMLLITAVLLLVFVVSAVNLIDYGLDYAASQQASAQLRRENQQLKEAERQSAALMTALPTETPAPTPESTPISQPEPAQLDLAALPTATPVSRLKPLKYPANPYSIVSNRFQKLRRQNPDIIGWITIDEMLDEAVVQRDNKYYLTRDYKGYHNVNGAIFLDETCDLRTRPYSLMLYGHNMKTGLMFGGLRNYENITYYRNNPFITFDTLYEDGRYVVFSVCTVSTDADDWRYINWSWLNSTSVELRQKVINELLRFSIYSTSINVRADDQLLLLITCVDEASDRRVIAARRIRDNEGEEYLKTVVNKTRKK